MLAAERKRCWRSASRASVTSSMMLTASTTAPCSSRTGVALVTAPALLAGRLDDRVRERRAWLLAGQRVAPGQVAQVEGPPVLVEDDEGVEQLGQRRREHLVGRRAAHHLGGGLVDVDDAAVGRLHGHGGGEVGEHRLELALRSAQLGEQARVVEGQRGAARDLAGQLGVGVVVARRAAEAHEAQHPDRPPAGDQRHRQRGGVAGAQHELQVLLVDGEGAQALGPDLVLQVRAAGARRDRDGVRPAGVERIARARRRSSISSVRGSVA